MRPNSSGTTTSAMSTCCSACSATTRRGPASCCDTTAWTRLPRGPSCGAWIEPGRRRTPLCGKALFVKRALALAAAHADDRGDQHISAEHLLHAVLRDAADPYGTGLGRRGRKHLAQLGWTLGTTNPAAAILAAHHLDPTRLSTQI